MSGSVQVKAKSGRETGWRRIVKKASFRSSTEKWVVGGRYEIEGCRGWVVGGDNNFIDFFLRSCTSQNWPLGFLTLRMGEL